MGPENRAVSLETRIRLVLECLTRALLLLLTRASPNEPGREGEEGYSDLEVSQSRVSTFQHLVGNRSTAIGGKFTRLSAIRAGVKRPASNTRNCTVSEPSKPLMSDPLSVAGSLFLPLHKNLSQNSVPI